MGKSRLEQVAAGQAEEKRVLARWMEHARTQRKIGRIIRSRDTEDFDFLLLDSAGLPLTYIEIKTRSTQFRRFRDVIAPERKHAYALRLLKEHRIPFVMVTEYPDALVEVDLTQKPARTELLTRRDRPGESKMHCHWEGEQIVVLDATEDDDDVVVA